MNGTSLLLILIGVFIIVNSQNFVGVFQGNKSINLDLTPSSASNTSTTSTTKSTSAQAS